MFFPSWAGVFMPIPKIFVWWPWGWSNPVSGFDVAGAIGTSAYLSGFLKPINLERMLRGLPKQGFVSERIIQRVHRDGPAELSVGKRYRFG
jgi:hypothetical protein